MNLFFNKTLLIVAIVLSCLFWGGSSVSANQEESVVFYPTDVTQAGDLAYLRDSMRLMLASRLASTAGGSVRLEDKLLKERDFSSYRIDSRIVSSADGVELSIVAFRPSSDSPLVFKSLAREQSGMMSALDSLVADVQKTFSDAQQTTVQTTEKTGQQQTKRTDLSNAHPDRLFKLDSGYGLTIDQEDYIAELAVEVRATERYKSAVLSFRSKAMTAGDIDGDGLIEILIATNAKLHIYQLKDNEIQGLGTYSLPGGLNVHGVNVADINGDGLMEIYISSTRKKEPRSFVLQWSPATGIDWLYENVLWYLRPLKITGEGVVLAGQQSGVTGLVQPGIHRMISVPGDKITGGERLPVPDSVNLFGFVFADLEGDKVPEIVAINRKEQLQVFDSNLQLLYTSPSGFGGRELSKELTTPVRLVVSDVDSDGIDDILLVDNELSSPKIFSKTKLYKNGQVRGLLWDGKAFAEMWRTNVFQNAVVDFDFLALPGDTETGVATKGRLFIIEPAKSDILQKLLFGDGGSRLSVYGMDFIPKAGSR